MAPTTCGTHPTGASLRGPTDKTRAAQAAAKLMPKKEQLAAASRGLNDACRLIRHIIVKGALKREQT